MYQPNMFETHHQLLDMAAGHKNPDNDLGKMRDDEFESSRSATENLEGLSGDDQDPNQRPKKKRYHRHTQHQIQEMEK